MKNLFLLMCIILYSNSETFCQIIYTNVEPDAIVGQLFIDIDKDGKPEYEILNTSYKNTFTQYSVTQYTGIIVNENYVFVENGQLALLNNSDSVKISNSIDTLGGKDFYRGIFEEISRESCQVECKIAEHNDPLGVFQNKYLGILFKIDNAYHYGWIKIDKINQAETEIDQIIVKSYAYNSVPNEPFKIEDPFPSSISSINNKLNITAYPNPFEDVLYLNSSYECIIKTRISNIEGKIALEKNVNSKTATIETGLLVKGIYILTIETVDGKYSKLIIK